MPFQKGHLNYNKKVTDKTKKKISKARKGMKFSEKTKQKMSESAKKRVKRLGIITPHLKGNKHYNWKGGITLEIRKIRASIEFKSWRESVFIRDNFTCQKTEIRGNKLHAHHIKNFGQYPESRFVIDNGITLSKIAHIEFHSKYGYKNNTKEQLEEFLIN